MNKKLKIPLSIVLSGYMFSLGLYFIWCFYFFYERPYRDDYFLVIAASVFTITVVYLLPLLLISYIKSFQKVWESFSLVSIITLLFFFLIPPTNYEIYHMYFDNKLILKRDKTIKTIEKNELEREIVAANNIKINKQLEDAKEKIQTKQKRKEQIASKLNNSTAINDIVKKSTAELQAKLEFECKENDKLRKRLNETIRKMISLEEERKTKGDIVAQIKSDKNISKIKINSNMVNKKSDTINQEIIFKVQILSSSVRLATNDPLLKDIGDVWEYKENGLYKYTVGNQIDLKSASELQSEVRNKGFSGAFVVAFKNGKRIKVRDARKLLAAY